MSRPVAERVTSYFQGLFDKEGYNRGEIRWDEKAQISYLTFKAADLDILAAMKDGDSYGAHAKTA